MSFRIEDRVDTGVSPAKGRLPVAISYSTIPNEKMSERESTGLPSACSGDMYWTVPTIFPSAVIVAVASAAPCA